MLNFQALLRSSCHTRQLRITTTQWLRTAR